MTLQIFIWGDSLKLEIESFGREMISETLPVQPGLCCGRPTLKNHDRPLCKTSELLSHYWSESCAALSRTVVLLRCVSTEMWGAWQFCEPALPAIDEVTETGFGPATRP